MPFFYCFDYSNWFSLEFKFFLWIIFKALFSCLFGLQNVSILALSAFDEDSVLGTITLSGLHCDLQKGHNIYRIVSFHFSLIYFVSFAKCQKEVWDFSLFFVICNFFIRSESGFRVIFFIRHFVAWFGNSISCNQLRNQEVCGCYVFELTIFPSSVLYRGALFFPTILWSLVQRLKFFRPKNH